MTKAIVLSSGGLDSTTCVGLAVDIYGSENVTTVSVFYGQRHKKELQCAKDVAKYYNVAHYELDLSTLFKYSNCVLLENSENEIEHSSYADQLKSKEIVTTYVPFRNGLMLSAIATLGSSLFPDDNVEIMIGAHADDAAGNAYADCSIEFLRAINKSIEIGTYHKCKVVAPFAELTKADVVAAGLKLNVPYELTWSCYCGGDIQCGTCGTCIDRKQAFAINGKIDPVPYKE